MIILNLMKRNLSMIFYILKYSDDDLDTSAKFDFFSLIRFPILSTFMCHAKKLSKHEIKLSTKPWIAKDILAKVRHRDKLYSRINKCKQPNLNLIALHKKTGTA